MQDNNLLPGPIYMGQKAYTEGVSKEYNPFSRVRNRLAYKSWLFGWNREHKLRTWGKARDEHRASICTSNSRGGKKAKCDKSLSSDQT